MSMMIPQKSLIPKMQPTMKRLFSNIYYISHGLIMVSQIHQTVKVFPHSSNWLRAPIVIFLYIRHMQKHLRTHVQCSILTHPLLLAALLVLDVLELILLFHLCTSFWPFTSRFEANSILCVTSFLFGTTPSDADDAVMTWSFGRLNH